MEWINILKCPITGEGLRLLSPEALIHFNGLIEEGQIFQAGGDPAASKFVKVLTTESGEYHYPVIEGIVVLLTDAALTNNKDRIVGMEQDADKQLVRNFYNQKGWFTNEDGDYEDAVIYEDLREVSAEYIRKCHDRVSRYLNPAGDYMLDAASGALQFNDYLQYSAGYKYRVCVDFSFQALKEAQKKLGEKGIYVLADMTNMPFRDGVMGGFVSLNTIYHIPKDQQVTAIRELYRVLAPGGRGVVVYDWFKHSLWMNIGLLPFRGFVFLKNRLMALTGKITGAGAPAKRLYFYAHTLDYLRKHLPPFKLAVWRSLSVPFMRYYVHGTWGKKLLQWIYEKEEKQPEICGAKGEYPMFVFEKK